MAETKPHIIQISRDVLKMWSTRLKQYSVEFVQGEIRMAMALSGTSGGSCYCAAETATAADVDFVTVTHDELQRWLDQLYEGGVQPTVGELTEVLKRPTAVLTG